ncbi:MAG: phage terminase large subunit [Anaerolineae bacterium]|nr:phage terminase large subunit [Anaerolineae bacterium]
MRTTIRRRHLPAQAAFIDSGAPELMFSGAFGAGKTRALCDKIVKLSLECPGNRGLLCRKTEVSVRATTLRTLLDGDGTLPPALLPEYIAEHRRTDRTVTLVNGSEIIYGGMFGAGKGWINSLNLGWAAADQAEELELDDWQLLQGRLRLDAVPLRQVFGACNPRHPGHWIYQRFFIDRPPGAQVFNANTHDNPHLPADYRARLQTFTGPFYERFVLGKWVGLEGLVYDNFDPLVHVIEPFPLDPAWRRWRSIDFGYVNPFVCLWACEVGAQGAVPEGSIVVYRELYMSRRRVAEMAEQIAQLSEGERCAATFADHDAADRAELLAHGIGTAPAHKEITVGLQTVRAWLGGDGAAPRLYFFCDALVERDARLTTDPVTGGKRYAPTCTAEEFSFYRWPAQGDGKPLKEYPLKVHDHGMDALRYLLMGIEHGGGAFVEARGTQQGSRWKRRF